MNTKVLLVENWDIDARVTESLLGGSSFKLEVFPFEEALTDPDALLSKARTCKDSVVLIDVALDASESGLRLCDHLLDNGWPLNRVALYTIYADHQTVLEYARRRGVTIIEKGTEREALRARLCELIGRGIDPKTGT